MITNLIISIGISYLLMTMMVPYFRNLAINFKLLDFAGAERKIHINDIPLIGGVSIALSVLIAIGLNFSTFDFQFVGLTPLFFGAITLLITGIVDDKIGLSPYLKLTIQLFCAYLLVAQGIYLDHTFGLFGLIGIPLIIKKIITIFFIVGMVNAYNLIDGIDGLAGSLFLLAFAGFGMISYAFGSYNTAMVCGIISGALIGFLKFNLSQSKKIFMGDSGSLSLGFILSGLSISLIEQSFTSSNFNNVIILILSLILLPIFDELRVFYRRMKNGKSPFYADKSHIHHIMLLLEPNHKKVKNWILAIVAVNIFSTVIISYLLGFYVALSWILLYYFVLLIIIGLQQEMVFARDELTKLEK